MAVRPPRAPLELALFCWLLGRRRLAGRLSLEIARRLFVFFYKENRYIYIIYLYVDKTLDVIRRCGTRVACLISLHRGVARFQPGACCRFPVSLSL